MATAGGLLVLVGAVGAAPSSAAPVYNAFARANGVDTFITNPSIPTGIALEGAGPAAQALQTSLGIGDASAQMPYAGDTVPGLPGTVLPLLGLPSPPYPFLASTNRGQSPQTFRYPGVTLSARSPDFTTEASAVVGGDASGATAVARVEEARDGTITAESGTQSDALTLGPFLTLTGFRTVARVVVDADSQQPTKTTTTSIGRLSAPGLVLAIPKETPAAGPAPSRPIPMGGTTLKDPDIGLQDGAFTVTVPAGDGAPITVPVPAQAALDAFMAVGITITYQKPQLTKTGVLSGTYTFKYRVPAPPNNPSINGPTDVIQTTALALAQVDTAPVGPEASSAGGNLGRNGAAGGASTPGDGTSADETAGGATPLSDDTGEASTADGLAAGSVDQPVVALPEGKRGTSEEQLARTNSRTASLGGFLIGTGIGDVYLALVAVALVGFVSATGLRLVGVRFLWS